MENVLFVSLSNSSRGPTASKVYTQEMTKQRRIVHVKSVGIDPFCPSAFNKDVLEWADKIFVMEEYMLDYLNLDLKTRKKAVVLEIPGIYFKNQANLLLLLEKKFAAL